MNSNNLKNMKQTNENKVIVDDYLLSLLQDHKCTKDELRDLLHLSERRIRFEIQKISLFYPVISYSCSKGYRVVNTSEVVNRANPNEIRREKDEIEHTLHEINSRIKMLKKKEHALIKSLKVLEKCQMKQLKKTTL